MELWRKNLYSLWCAQFIAALGLNMVVPFLPLYLRELGIEGDKSMKIWSGVVFAAPFVISAFMQPLWGILGDRYGRKLMIVRAMLGLSLAHFLMGFAQSAPQFLFFRIFQGFLSGFIAPSLALLASCTPRGENRLFFGNSAVGTDFQFGSRPSFWWCSYTLYGLPTYFLRNRVPLPMRRYCRLLFRRRKIRRRRK